MKTATLTKLGTIRIRKPGAGRKRLPKSKRRIARFINMQPEAWRALESAARAAHAKNIHAHLESIFLPLSA